MVTILNTTYYLDEILRILNRIHFNASDVYIDNNFNINLDSHLGVYTIKVEGSFVNTITRFVVK